MAETTSRSRRVFISYSHDSTAHSGRIANLAQTLRSHGIDVELDQFHREEILDWPRWCNEQTSRECSDFVVCVCTAEYERRISGKVAPEKGRGVHWEGALLDDDLYDAKGNSRLIPILLDDEPDASIPRFLRGWTHCTLRNFTLEDSGYEHLLRILTGQASVEKNALGEVPVLGSRRTASGATAPARLALREMLVPIAVLTLGIAAALFAREQYPSALWVVIGLAVLWEAVVVWFAVDRFRRRRREAILRDAAILPLPTFEADYFRVGPYSGSPRDRQRYHRPDDADVEILAWVRDAADSILYLSGLSGAGKSSLLNASLLPALAVGEPPRQIIAIPEHSDPIAHLCEALLTPGAVWKNPDDDRRDEPIATLLAAACQHLERSGRRLFLLCDQFEVILLRHQAGAEEVLAFAELLRAIATGRRKTFPGLTVLLSYRSDYDDLLKTLRLPRWVDGKNGRRIAPFSRLVARQFLADPASGLQLTEIRLNEVLDEAEAVTGTPGLIRPIALNMLGVLLQSHAGRDPASVPRGALLAHDVRRAVEVESIRAHARPVLSTLLSEGLRVPRTVAESAAATGFAPALVTGCYQQILLDRPLVRCIEDREDDPAQSRWEIAHDFIARLLAPILETPRRTLVERVRPFVTPALLILTLIISAALWLGRENAILVELQALGIHANVLPDEVHARAVQMEKVTNANLPQIARLLRGIRRPLTLQLNGCRALQNIDGLKGLTYLQRLDLTHCAALQNVDVPQGLTSLQRLDLSLCESLQNVHGLNGLTSLKELDLAGCPGLQNVDGLKGLASLERLGLSSCDALQNVDGLQGLISLQTLELAACRGLKNIDGLKGLTSLQNLNVSNCESLQNVDGLKGLTSLNNLDLSFCKSLQNINVIEALPALTILALREVPVRDGRLFAALQSKSVILELDEEQEKALAEFEAGQKKEAKVGEER